MDYVVFNIGTGIPTLLNELVDALKDIMDIESIQPTFRDPVLGDMVYSCSDIKRSGLNLIFCPQQEFRTAWYPSQLDKGHQKEMQV